MPRSSLGRALLAALLLPTALPAQDAQPEARQERTSRASVQYSRTQFLEGPSPWNLLTTEVSTRTGAGTLVGRATLADRFGQTGFQVEADAYPRLSQSLYAYLNLGYSPSGLFPTLRYGGELFANAGGGWEVSAGARRLDFESTEVTILTGSVGRYFGNYWISARPFVTPRDDGTSASLQGSLRRYFSDARHYVTLYAGGGSAVREEVIAAELERLNSARIGLDGKTPLRGSPLRLQWSLGFEHEQLPSERSRDRVTASLGLERAF